MGKRKSKSRSTSKNPSKPRLDLVSSGNFGDDSLSSRSHFRSAVSRLRDDLASFDDDTFSIHEEDELLTSNPVALMAASEPHARVDEIGVQSSDSSSLDVVSAYASASSPTKDIPSGSFPHGPNAEHSVTGMSRLLFSDELPEGHHDPVQCSCSSGEGIDSFTQSDDVIPIPNCISQKGLDLWSLAIVGQFVDGRKSFHFVKFWAFKLWGSKVDKIYMKGNGLFIFCFNCEEDLQFIQNSGPIFFGRSLLIFQRWCPGMDLVVAQPDSVPIWIQFHNVPLELWHDDGFDFIASRFGMPLKFDDFTKYGNKLSFARICVDVAVSTELPRSFKVQTENSVVHEIEVVVPWKPRKCMKCKIYGHSDSNCLSGSQRMVGISGKRKFEWRKKYSSIQNPLPHPASSLESTELNAKNITSPMSPAKANDVSLNADEDLVMSSVDDSCKSDIERNTVECCTPEWRMGSVSSKSPDCGSPSLMDRLCSSLPVNTPDSRANKRVLFLPSAEVNEYVSINEEEESVSSSDDEEHPTSYSGISFNNQSSSLLSGNETDNQCCPANHADFLLDKVLNARQAAFSTFVSLKPCLKISNYSSVDPT